MEPVRRAPWIKPGSVYVIPAGKYVKIGVTSDIRTRWSDLKTANPHIEKPLYVSPRIPNSVQVENICHGMLKRYRIKRSEWFTCSRYLAEAVVRLVVDRFEK